MYLNCAGLLRRGDFKHSGCEFCFASLVPALTMATHRKEVLNYPGMPLDMADVSPVIYSYEMTCTYNPGMANNASLLFWDLKGFPTPKGRKCPFGDLRLLTISDTIKGKRSKCAKNIDDFKSAFVEEAKSNGVHMQQYYNTPTCDRQGFVSKMFHPKVYKWMLKTKSYWDPNNIFNHCFSVGSTREDCCPNPI